MKGRTVCTTKRDDVLATLKVDGTRAELSVVDLTTGAPSGSVVFPVAAVGALIWTLQGFYDKAENDVAKSTSAKTETKKRAKKRSKKE